MTTVAQLAVDLVAHTEPFRREMRSAMGTVEDVGRKLESHGAEMQLYGTMLGDIVGELNEFSGVLEELGRLAEGPPDP